MNNQQLTSWFHRQTSRSGAMTSALMMLAKNLCDVGRAPRRIEPFKYYMRQSPYKEKINEVYQERWPGANLEANFRLWFHTTIAKELFEAEDDATKERMAKEAEESYEEDFAAYQELAHADKIAVSKLETFGDLAKNM
jgi:hypothetical protein